MTGTPVNEVLAARYGLEAAMSSTQVLPALGTRNQLGQDTHSNF